VLEGEKKGKKIIVAKISGYIRENSTRQPKV